MSNQRTHERKIENAAIFLEMLATPDANEKNNILLCNAVDMSSRGLRVCVDEPIEQYSVLQMGVQLRGMAEPFYMVGEVRWCAFSTEGRPGYWVGFELLESAGTDYSTWQELVAQLEHS
jgi:hypothetical protein